MGPRRWCCSVRRARSTGLTDALADNNEVSVGSHILNNLPKTGWRYL
jgi:hypothetical protein